jgi:hypothetical protein
VHTAGVNDNFSTGNGVESPSPSWGLSQWIAANYPHPGIRNFDEGHLDQYFAHTFSGLWPANGAQICNARLVGRVRHTHYNDGMWIGFYDDNGNQFGPSWGSSFSSLGIPVGGVGMININIGSLPGGAAILAQMASGGWLDFLAQDDMMFDYLELHVDYCCPCEGYSAFHQAGVVDNFSLANGYEPASPSSGLASYIAGIYPWPGLRAFDELHWDQWFAHTFTGLEPQNNTRICDATLSTVIHHGGNGNDTLGIFFTDAAGNPFGPSWGDSLANLGIPVNTSAGMSFNIGSLPGGAGFLAQMESSGFLDFIIQDDSVSDYLQLELNYCCEGGPISAEPGPNPVE